MCGIAGIWHRNGTPANTELLRDMIRVQAHRGREGMGVWTSGDLGLSHGRLSIIDLSANGRQPMVSADGRLCISYNGEIHNYVELRAELVAAGYPFRTQTDTEVILAAYQQWGCACFEKFNGMWALALWDESRRTLILCRDRFGIKPLLYSVRGTRVVFASEAKSILAVCPEEREPDHRQIHRYLKAGVTDFGEDTFFAHIKVLAPATFLRITTERVAVARYWSYVPGEESPRADAVEEFRSLLTDAVRIRLRSDAPMGMWLSGGLDSSVVTRIARSLVTQPLECYSQRYDGWARDESAYAAAVADEPTHYRMHWITPAALNMQDTIRKLVWHHDAPTPSRGRFAMWSIAQATAADQTTVVLTGDGADELFGGYASFIVPYLWDRLRRVKAGTSPGIAALWREAADLSRVNKMSVMRLLNLCGTPLMYKAGLERRNRTRVLARDYDRTYNDTDPSAYQAGWMHYRVERPYRSALNNALWWEFTRRGLPEILHGSDAVSMAHTLELRSPFLDHRVVEFCFSLPYDEKMRNGWTKSLLRRAFADVLPERVVNRRNKLGFESPAREWLGGDPAGDGARDLLLDGLAVRQGIFDARRLETTLARYRSLPPEAARAAGELVWRWISVELWLQLFSRDSS